MSVQPIQPQPFFADKNRAFWNLQSVGWAGAFLLRGSSTIANGQPLSSLIPVMISTVSGYSVTLLIAVIFRFLQRQRPIITWGASIVTVVMAAGLVAFIDAWVFSTQNRASETAGLQLFLGAFYLSITMLRYQLNPHFLFNTLNSISTLVLLKQTDRANAMLSRLSSFLRYTLINEPTAQVTIEQEVETLKLYLEIEKMRFEDRLRPVFNIDPAVAQSRLPSLLLQPLVENAIKYAVTPKEEGAEISITAQPAGENVRIVVSDSGPGLNEGFTRPNIAMSEGTGVGLANIRDRLIQAFGERQSFETRSTPSGFSVHIEMPLNLDEPSKVAA